MKRLLTYVLLALSPGVFAQNLLQVMGDVWYSSPSGGTNPWPNVTVTILDDPLNGPLSTWTLVTDANGFYMDTLNVGDTTGVLTITVDDCNGNTYTKMHTYDVPPMWSIQDTFDIPCPPGGSGGGGGGCNASFIVDTVNSFGGQVVLWNMSTAGNPASSLNYQWDFGDGTTSNLAFPTHGYSTSGMYYVCLTITETGGGAVCTDTYCDSLGMDSNGNLIYKGQSTGFNLVVLDPNSIGVEEVNLENLTLFPNPATQSFRLTGLTGGKEYSYTLMDLSGRQVQTGSIRAEEPIRVEHLDNGIYLLNVRTEGASASLRLSVNH